MKYLLIPFITLLTSCGSNSLSKSSPQNERDSVQKIQEPPSDCDYMVPLPLELNYNPTYGLYAIRDISYGGHPNYAYNPFIEPYFLHKGQHPDNIFSIGVDDDGTLFLATFTDSCEAKAFCRRFVVANSKPPTDLDIADGMYPVKYLNPHGINPELEWNGYPPFDYVDTSKSIQLKIVQPIVF